MVVTPPDKPLIELVLGVFGPVAVGLALPPCRLLTPHPRWFTTEPGMGYRFEA